MTEGSAKSGITWSASPGTLGLAANQTLIRSVFSQGHRGRKTHKALPPQQFPRLYAATHRDCQIQRGLMINRKSSDPISAPKACYGES